MFVKAYPQITLNRTNLGVISSEGACIASGGAVGISPPPIFPASSNCSSALSGGGAGVGPVLSGGIGRGGGSCCCNEGGCLGDSREPTPESGGSGGGCDGDGGASSFWA